jgi:hypothetical protein
MFICGFHDFIVLIAYLTWKHIQQAKQAVELLKEAKTKKEQLAEERAQFITNQFIAEKQKTKEKGRKLTKEELLHKALSYRGFAPILYKSIDEDAVYAVDETGFRHWIPNPVTLGRMGYTFADVREMPKQELDLIPRDEDIPNLAKLS